MWKFAEATTDLDFLRMTYDLHTCPFCNSKLKIEFFYIAELELGYCLVCGWYKAYNRVILENDYAEERYQKIYAAAYILKKLNLNDVHMPISIVKKYLAAKYESRREVHPRLMEETVASVFEDFGYKTFITSYSNDNGIDIILTDLENNEIGVQVKRYNNKIKVEQIRAFTGALVLGGYTKGIFVTINDYQKGAINAVNKANAIGIKIELYDAQKLYDALKIVRITEMELKASYPTSSGGLLEIGIRPYWPKIISRYKKNREHKFGTYDGD